MAMYARFPIPSYLKTCRYVGPSPRLVPEIFLELGSIPSRAKKRPHRDLPQKQSSKINFSPVSISILLSQNQSQNQFLTSFTSIHPSISIKYNTQIPKRLNSKLPPPKNVLGRSLQTLQTPRHSQQTHTLHLRPGAPPRRRPQSPALEQHRKPRSRSRCHRSRWRASTLEPIVEHLSHRIDTQWSAIKFTRDSDPVAQRKGM